MKQSNAILLEQTKSCPELCNRITDSLCTIVNFEMLFYLLIHMLVLFLNMIVTFACILDLTVLIMSYISLYVNRTSYRYLHFLCIFLFLYF